MRVLKNKDENITVSIADNLVASNPIGTYGLTSNGETFSLAYKTYNPSMYRYQVAQMAMYANQLALNNVLLDKIADKRNFMGIDNVSLEEEINNPKYQYRVASQLKMNGGGLWFKPYATIEDISLNRGLKVKNKLFGAVIGADLPTSVYEDGTTFKGTLFAGYTGSSQDYSGLNTDQNGGFGGFMATMYKKNLFSSLLASFGGVANEVGTPGGKDDFNSFVASIHQKQDITGI